MQLVIKPILSLLSLIYLLLVNTRLWLYKKGLLNSFTAGVPVISVGNLTIGGSGKTPMVDYLLTLINDNNS